MGVALACAPAPVYSQTAQTVAAPISVDTFARSAAENNLSEVLLATIAIQKTSDKRVQDDAWTMLDHHSRAMGERLSR